MIIIEINTTLDLFTHSEDLNIFNYFQKNNMIVNNPGIENNFVDIFKTEFAKFPKEWGTICEGTFTPFPINNKTNKFYTFDKDIIDFILSNSPWVNVTIGEWVNEEKGKKKVEIWELLYKEINKIKFISDDILPLTLYHRLKLLPEDIPVKIVIKMSGEWSKYIPTFLVLHKEGRRNMIVSMFKIASIYRKFVLQILDLRKDKIKDYQVPEIPSFSRELNPKRINCPRCHESARYTKYIENRELHHECTTCGFRW